MTDRFRFDTIRYEEAEGVATIALNRPEVLNAFSISMQSELSELLEWVAARTEVRAVLLTGEGRAFFSGGDLAEMDALAENSSLERRNKLHRMLHSVLMPLITLERPVVAAVNGATIGAGMNLALAADLVVASETAIFGQAFVKFGLVPDTGGLYLLPRLVGLSRAKELCFTGRSLTAAEALQLGLVSRVVASADLIDESWSLARDPAQGATAAIGLTKSLLNLARTSSLQQLAEFEAYALSVAVSTEDHREGVAAFGEKRSPRFMGR